jgi:hypothetical protein
MDKKIEVNKKSNTYQEYETVAGNAEVLRTTVKEMTGEEISLDTAVLCAMLDQRVASRINSILHDIATEIYKNCT